MIALAHRGGGLFEARWRGDRITCRFTSRLHFDLAGARMQLGLDHRSARIEETTAHEWRATATESLSGVTFDVTIAITDDRLRMSGSIENRGSTAVRLERISLIDAAALSGGLLRLASGWGRARVFKNGWSVASPAGWIDAETGDAALELRVPRRLLPRWLDWMTHDPHPETPLARGRTTSESVLAIAAERGGFALVAGALGSRRFFTTLALDTRDDGFTVTQWGDGATLAAGARVEMESVEIIAGPSAETLLEGWAERVGHANAARVPNKRRVAWATWYAGAYTGLDEHWVHERVAALRASGAPVDSVIVDDGYQVAHGDWLEASPRIPSGLAALARHIREAGFAPGLWIAPFSVAPESRIARAHPDWLVRDERGRPLATAMILSFGKPTPTYSLDTTHPEVLAHLAHTASTLVGHGFEILKIDFLTAGAAPGARFDRGATRAMAYARGLEAIRAGAGDAWLVAAIAPLVANTGWVDCQRLAPDTAYGRNRWLTPAQRWVNDRSSPGIRNNLATNLARAFLGGRLFGADPDAIVFDGISPELAELVATVNTLGAHLISLGHDFAKSRPDLTAVEHALALGPGNVSVPDAGRADALPRELTFRNAAGAHQHFAIDLDRKRLAR